MLKTQPGRKALIVLSDGEDNGSRLGLASAIEAAQRADTLVYAIFFKDKEQDDRPTGPMAGGRRGPGGWPGGGRRGGGVPGRGPGGQGRESRPDGKKILEKMAKETGGRMFEISKKQTIEQIYAQIQEELRNQYNLGYSSDQAAAGAGYRHIVLTTKRKEEVVQARDGYYADR